MVTIYVDKCYKGIKKKLEYEMKNKIKYIFYTCICIVQPIGEN